MLYTFKKRKTRANAKMMYAIPSAQRASKITLNHPMANVYRDNEFKFNSKNAKSQNQGMLGKVFKAFLL